MKVWELDRGQGGKIVAVRGDRALVERLAALGIAKGKHMTLEHVSPRGGVFFVRTPWAQAAIGRETADLIEVTP